MLWTLAASLLVLALAIIQFLRKVANKFKRNYFGYPSGAVIDQAMPKEIMEHIMTFFDPLTLLDSRYVSKYWNHLASDQKLEKYVREQAVQRAREVLVTLDRKGCEISNEEREAMLSYVTQNPSLFLRAAAVANKHGADLLVANAATCLRGNFGARWHYDKKYLTLMACASSYRAWSFSNGFFFDCRPQFDTSKLNWYDTLPGTEVLALINLATAPDQNGTAELYFYGTIRPQKLFLNFIPLDNTLLHVLLYLLTPLMVHDALYSTYLPTIKSWFGPICFVATWLLQILFIRIFTKQKPATNVVKILVAVLFGSSSFLTWWIYPHSMNVHAGVGIQALMFIYVMFSHEYFERENNGRIKMKLQILAVGVLLWAMMIDWKLVVDATRDLTIFRTLFNNTISYGVIVLYTIYGNFMAHCQDYGFRLKSIFDWDSGTARLVQFSFSLAVWMTLVAPTWQGNYFN